MKYLLLLLSFFAVSCSNVISSEKEEKIHFVCDYFIQNNKMMINGIYTQSYSYDYILSNFNNDCYLGNVYQNKSIYADKILSVTEYNDYVIKVKYIKNNQELEKSFSKNECMYKINYEFINKWNNWIDQ